MTHKILMFGLLYFFFSTAFGENQTPRSSKAFPEFFDSYFFRSINSTDYYVIHHKDLDKLKVYFSAYQDSSESLILDLKKTNQIIHDSLVFSKNSMNEMNQLMISNRSEFEKNNKSFFNQLLSIRISLTFLAVLSIILGFNYFKIKRKYVDDFESLTEIEKQFDKHKRNSVERERKLMREIIDLKNKIES